MENIFDKLKVYNQTVLSMKSEEALNFFLKNDQYETIELPEYFNFGPVLSYVKEKVGDKTYEECVKEGAHPEQLAHLNYDLVLNKDGHYATRPIMMANPYLYYFLSRELCGEENWKQVKALFEKLKTPHIEVASLPIIRRKKKEEKFYNATTILNWWRKMEQQAIELSLEYRYMFITDITDCYGSIRLDSLDEVFTLKGTKHEMEASTMGANVKKLLHVMQQGRNVGIPQGSALFDFVSEIVLGYADLLLHEAVVRAKIKAPYKVLRYRDDYRIFCNDHHQLEQITFLLQEVLAKLNFKMNSKKTKFSESIVTDAIKPDKLDLIYDLPLLREQEYMDFRSYEKALLYILLFARKHPDSGQARMLLTKLNDRLGEHMKRYREKRVEDLVSRTVWISIPFGDDKSKESELSEEEKKAADEERREERRKQMTEKVEREDVMVPGGSIRAMVAVATQIALENVCIAQYTLPIILKLIQCLGEKRMEERCELCDLVYEKLHSLHNADYLLIWLQNLTYALDNAKKKKTRYESPLCQLVMGKKEVQLWDCSWLLPELCEDMPYDKIVDHEDLKEKAKVIRIKRVSDYDEVDVPDELGMSAEEWDAISKASEERAELGMTSKELDAMLRAAEEREERAEFGMTSKELDAMLRAAEEREERAEFGMTSKELDTMLRAAEEHEKRAEFGMTSKELDAMLRAAEEREERAELGMTSEELDAMLRAAEEREKRAELGMTSEELEAINIPDELLEERKDPEISL